MALSISQIIAVSYTAVLNKKRSPSNQWAENGLMREMERQNMIEMDNFGQLLEVTLDYQANPSFGFLASDLQPLSTSKTEVLTAAQFDIAELSGSIVWSKKDDVQNPSENQKVSRAKSLITNAISSHDNAIEQALFATSTNGFLGLLTHVPNNGQSSDGGIDSTSEVFWRSQNGTYVDDTDIEAGLTTLWNACSKGSGSDLTPTLLTSDGATQALFEGTQQPMQRYVDTQELKAGFKIIGFKTARWAFSQYGNTRVYMLNNKSLKLKGAKGYFREMDETQPLPNANGYLRKVYSALQTVTDNRSRLGVLHT